MREVEVAQRCTHALTSISGSNSTGTSAHSRIFDAPNTRLSSSSTLQSPVEAIKKVCNPASALVISDIDLFQDSHYIPARSQSPARLKLSHEMEYQDDFGDLFADLDSKRDGTFNTDNAPSKPFAPAVLRAVRALNVVNGFADHPQESEPMLGNASRMPFASRANKTPPPFPFAKSGNAQGSPYSYNGRTSRDGLMASPTLAESPPPDEAPVPPPHQSNVNKSSGFLSPPIRPGLERMASAESFSRSGAEGDSDALMVRESFRAHRASTEPPSSMYPGSARSRVDMLRQETSPLHRKPVGSTTSSSANSVITPSLSSNSNSSLESGQTPATVTQTAVSTGAAPNQPSPSNPTTPRATKTTPINEEEDEPLFANTDASTADALLALNLSEHRTASNRADEPQKVYTAAQFKILKKHEMSNDTVDEDETASDVEYDDDEDDEATRMQKRRMQEHKDAQHKIWRQRMTKAIGDQSSGMPGRPSFPRVNQSTPNIPFSNHSLMASASEGGGSGGSSDDEDVPLGVLQAHGFPSKNRPPDARLSAHSFVGIPRPASSIGPLPRPDSPGGSRSVVGGPRGSLPPFARKLPQDPYIGASDLVNPANREALGFNSQRAPSVYTPSGALPQPNIPNGLVGVIAEEERQRSMRRGSPNQPGLRQSSYMPIMAPQAPMPMMPGMNPGMMPMAGMPPAVPGQDQQQLNQQMFQLLQQQTMMIQQLMSQGGLPHGMAQQPPFPDAQMNPQNRPMSMAAGSVRPAGSRTMSMVNFAPPSQQARTMSMINFQPNMGPAFSMDTVMPSGSSVRGLGLNGHYAPSVAPSERSNVGQPSRYKPVQSSVLADGGSTITAETVQASNANGDKKKGFLSAIIHPANKGRGKENSATDDDDDDWSNFAARRRGHA